MNISWEGYLSIEFLDGLGIGYESFLTALRIKPDINNKLASVGTLIQRICGEERRREDDTKLNAFQKDNDECKSQ